MSYKQLEAMVALAAVILVSAWIANDATSHPEVYATTRAVAGKLLWAVGYIIVLNIVLIIIGTIVVSVVRREEFKDERADERDKAIGAKSMRNSSIVLSVGGLATLIVFATGAEATAAAYTLFAAMMLAGATESVSRLIYYRLG